MADNSINTRRHFRRENNVNSGNHLKVNNYRMQRYKRECKCFVEKSNKFVQTDDIGLTIVNVESCIDDINKMDLNISENTSSSYKTCSPNTTFSSSSSTSSISDETATVQQLTNSSVSSVDETTPKQRQTVVPRSICKNRTPVRMIEEEQEFKEIKPRPTNQTNRRSKSPIFIPAGYKFTGYPTNKNNRIHQTETQNDTTELKPVGYSCGCPNFCNNWQECGNWLSNNLNFGGSSIEPQKSLFSKESSTTNAIQIKKIINDNLVIHGRHLPKPTSIINKEIRSVIDDSRIDEATKYSWTIITRRLNLFIINKKPTFSNYLPSICSSVLETSFYQDLIQFTGPILIILTPLEETSIGVHQILRNLLKNTEKSPEIRLITNQTKNIKSCDILIVDAQNLLELLQKSKLSLKRCCHLILESLDHLIGSHADFLAKFLKILNVMLSKRPVTKTFQLIATSTMWMRNYDVFLKKFNASPVVIFNDCLFDVAIYSNVNFIRKTLKANFIKFYLSDTLKDHWQMKRILIFCRDQNEICEISQYLTNVNINNFKLMETANDEEIDDYGQTFQKLTSGSYKVLICSDISYKKLQNVHNIDWIINCGFSGNWQDFVDRFKCMVDNFTSPLENVASSDDRCSCYFIINEGDEQAGKMYDNFMRLYSKRAIEKFKF